MARDPTQDTGDRALAQRLSPISIRFQPNKQLYLEKKYKPYKAANNAHGHEALGKQQLCWTKVLYVAGSEDEIKISQTKPNHDQNRYVSFCFQLSQKSNNNAILYIFS